MVDEEHVVGEGEAGERLDRFLAAKGRSRATIQRWIKEGRVEIDGRAASASAKLRAGERVRVRPAPAPRSAAVPEEIPLSILYEDEHLVAIDKPPGMVVHPAAGHSSGTLVNAILHHFGALPGEAERPGIVHRLDALTSGVMVIARSPAARDALVAMFAAHTMERAYLAIALGSPPEAITFDTRYGRHPKDRKRFTSKVEGGKRAVTHVRTVERLRGAALVRCTLETGRTHQIRVHLSDHGFPILGDPVYGKRTKDPIVRAAGEALGRQALHATLLAFPHPITGVPLRFETEPPDDFARARQALTEITST